VDDADEDYQHVDWEELQMQIEIQEAESDSAEGCSG
jgi:hypothetical protein